MEDIRQGRLISARRVVIKLGTSAVAGEDVGACTARLEPLVRSIAGLKENGRQVVLVSSGAIGLGRSHLDLARARLGDTTIRQACAAVGQSLLMHIYERLFQSHGLKVAQILLTEDDFSDRRRYSLLRRTMEKLLKLNVLPIVNENDTVSTAELEYIDGGIGPRVFGDNDRLAALVMSKLEADALIMLTNVDGLLRTGPGQPDSVQGNNKESAVIPLVTEIDRDLKALASGPSISGRGGMVTKLEAAEISMRAGGIAVIANGTRAGILDRIFAGEMAGTTFISETRIGGKRRWIRYAAEVSGKLVVNSGARDAILQGKASLLASGVVRVEDRFQELDVVSITDQEGHEFARGIANCASQEAEKLITGRESSQRQKNAKLGVLVRRENIVLM